MKLSIKMKKVYPEIMLKPELHHYSNDNCKIIYKENHIEVRCFIDGTGNWFKLPYKTIKEAWGCRYER